VWQRGGVYIWFSWRNLRGERPLERPRHRWENNIKMDLQEVRYWGMDWIELARDMERWRVFVNAVMNLRVPQIAGIF
jgi:hypothetical protein